VSCCPAPLDNGVASGSRRAPGWSLLARVDFTAEPTRDVVNGDNVLVDGRTFTGINVAAAATFRFVSGVGLQFVAGGNTAWNSGGGAFTAATLAISLNGPGLAATRRLLPTYDCNRQYLYQVRNTVNTGNAATEVLYFNLYSLAGTPYVGAANVVGGACKGGNATVASGVGVTTQVSTPVLIGDYAGDDVIGFTVSPGAPSAVGGSCGVYTTEWPAMPALRGCGWMASTATPAGLSAVRFNDPSLQLAISHPTGNGSATFASTCTELRVWELG